MPDTKWIVGVLLGAIGFSLLLPTIGWPGVIGLSLVAIGDTLTLGGKRRG